jgi:multidrug efflux pump subunit AcrB
MEKNIGESDKVFRWAGGLAIIIIGLAAKSWWGIIGIFPIILAIIGTCPVYLALGISTRNFDKK